MMKDIKKHKNAHSNIDSINKNIIDLLWKSLTLEGFNITFQETQCICDEVVPINTEKKLDQNVIYTANNLKRAWWFIIEELEKNNDLSFETVQKINAILGYDGIIHFSGQKRVLNVNIGGTSWKPLIPNDFDVRNDFYDILEDENRTETEKAIDLMLFLMKTQYFNDGNKRTAMLSCNYLLVKNCLGILNISPDQLHEFFALLINFYETNDSVKLKSFLYEKCIY